MLKKLLIVMLLAGVAGLTSMVKAEDIMLTAASGDWIQPLETEKTYVFDETATKEIMKSRSSLLKINCNPAGIITELGLDKTSTKIFSVGIEEKNFEYSFDFKNCSMRGSKKNYARGNTQTLTETKALQTAKDFAGNITFKKRIFDKFGEPVVTYRNGGNYPPLYKETGLADSSLDIEIDKTDIGPSADGYTSFTIIFPYIIGGKKVYNQYGGMAGVTMEVNADGVVSVSATLLPFRGALRNSEKVTEDQMINAVKRGGNNPYWGQEKEIKLDAPEKVLIYSTIRRNNINELYLSSGIRFGSQIKTDIYTQTNYEMILSDYRIFNTNVY